MQGERRPPSPCMLDVVWSHSMRHLIDSACEFSRAIQWPRAFCVAMVAAAAIAPAPVAALTWTRLEAVPAADVFSLQRFGTTLYAGAARIVYTGANDGTSFTPS